MQTFQRAKLTQNHELSDLNHKKHKLTNMPFYT